ncbi:hypothetical protein [Cytobacillus firmus]|uniref:hypothetical protein n=1 Tax=Cytobacillus firmus TaxID=1399 RepID=UPI001E5A5D19|nr:hypothetical protein [Cytobacillus firmus]
MKLSDFNSVYLENTVFYEVIKMLRFRVICLISIFILTACTRDVAVPEEKVKKEKNEENIAVTAVGKITFQIFNTVKVPQEKVEFIKEELLDAYDDIQNSIY